MINGTDVLLNEYVSDLSEKKIFDEMLNISRHSADIRFSRYLDFGTKIRGGGVRFNQCQSATDGFTMFYIQGKMDERNNILFNTSSPPVSIGPLCFRTCPVSVEARTTLTSTKPSTLYFNRVNEAGPLMGKANSFQRQQSEVKEETNTTTGKISFTYTSLVILFYLQ